MTKHLINNVRSYLCRDFCVSFLHIFLWSNPVPTLKPWPAEKQQWRAAADRMEFNTPNDGQSLKVARLPCHPKENMAMNQYLLIPFLEGWTSIYQLFWCSPGVQGFDTLPYSWCGEVGVGNHFEDVWDILRPWAADLCIRLSAEQHRLHHHSRRRCSTCE